MFIESLIRRAGGTHVTISGTKYHFTQKNPADPRHFAEVEDVDHIQALMAVKEGFRPLKEGAKPATGINKVPAEQAPAAEPAPKKPDTNKPAEAAKANAVKAALESKAPAAKASK